MFYIKSNGTFGRFDFDRYEKIYSYVIKNLEKKLKRKATDEESENEFERIQTDNKAMDKVYKATNTKPL